MFSDETRSLAKKLGVKLISRNECLLIVKETKGGSYRTITDEGKTCRILCGALHDGDAATKEEALAKINKMLVDMEREKAEELETAA